MRTKKLDKSFLIFFTHPITLPPTHTAHVGKESRRVSSVSVVFKVRFPILTDFSVTAQLCCGFPSLRGPGGESPYDRLHKDPQCLPTRECQNAGRLKASRYFKHRYIHRHVL